MGYPITDHDGLSSNPIERMQKIQHGATVQKAVGLNVAAYGRIYHRWIKAGGVNPITNEFDWRSDRGRINVFDRGVIVWSSTADAHVIDGFPLTEWITVTLEGGRFGLPINEPYADGIGEVQKF